MQVTPFRCKYQDLGESCIALYVKNEIEKLDACQACLDVIDRSGDTDETYAERKGISYEDAKLEL